MKEYEYKFEKTNVDKLNEQLNDLGKKGFKVIAIYPITISSVGNGSYHIFYERETIAFHQMEGIFSTIKKK